MTGSRAGGGSSTSAADSYIEVRGARLRVRDVGAGRPLVLLHGWTLNLDVWAPQLDALAARWRVIAHDRRGFGLSSGEPSLDSDVEDLAALLDASKLERVALVGASQGARVALRFALARPDLVTALVLDGPPDELGGEGGTGDDIPMAEYRALVERGDLDGMRRRWSEHPFTQLVTDDPAARSHLARMLSRYPARDLVSKGAPAPTPLGAAMVRTLRARLLVINGALDLESRWRGGRALAAAVPGAEHVLLPGAGHLPNLDAPAAYTAALERFFERTHAR